MGSILSEIMAASEKSEDEAQEEESSRKINRERFDIADTLIQQDKKSEATVEDDFYVPRKYRKYM